MEERKLNETMVRQLYNLSSLDNTGHGTHVAYTTAGSYVNNLQYYGLNMGTTRGGAPLARLAIYKVSRRDKNGVPSGRNGADILAAIDDAIRDGVDILSASLGSGPLTFDDGVDILSASLGSGPLTFDEVHAKSILGIGSFYAVSHSIPVVAAGGNSGPNSNTIANTSPWLITVAASNNDTQIVTPLTLGNNKTILPDVAAPGVNILATTIPRSGDNGFKLESGTSMATPHVSGIVALLKVAHPNRSPAAIKSALVTTAWNEDTYTTEIFSEGAGDKLADPFDFGGGICNPNRATDPGLVYDMDKDDYLNYLCSLGYSNDMVYDATTYLSSSKNSSAAGGVVCPKKVPPRLDLNLPSISIPNLKNSITVKRTVTNVGNVNSIYKVLVKPPRNTAIKVSPEVLKFNAKTKKISFEVKITSTHQSSTKFTFGSLAWSDGKHFVRIPIAVRKQIDA